MTDINEQEIKQLLYSYCGTFVICGERTRAITADYMSEVAKTIMDKIKEKGKSKRYGVNDINDPTKYGKKGSP